MDPYDDIWSRIDQTWICPYCAQESSPEPLIKRCPNCNRNLYFETLLYQKPTVRFYFYLMNFFWLALLLLLNIIFDILSSVPFTFFLSHAIWVVAIFVITPYLFNRRRFARIASLAVFFLLGAQYAIFYLTPVARTFYGIEDELILEKLYLDVLQNGGAFLLVAVIASIIFGLFVGLFLIGLDFATEKKHNLATVPLDLFRQSSATAHLHAVRFTEDGRWAQAVIYWRRANAAEPGRLLFYLHLGDAYRRLGFHRRAMDVLRSADEIATTEQGLLKLAQLRAKIPMDG